MKHAKFLQIALRWQTQIALRATLNFQKFKVALNPMYRLFLKLAKSCILLFLLKFDNIKKLTVPFLNY